MLIAEQRSPNSRLLLIYLLGSRYRNSRRNAVPAKSKLAGPLLTLHVVGTGKQVIEVLDPERMPGGFFLPCSTGS
jgi:hypothetical protein